MIFIAELRISGCTRLFSCVVTYVFVFSWVHKRFRDNHLKMFNNISCLLSDLQSEMYLIGVWQFLNSVKKNKTLLKLCGINHLSPWLLLGRELPCHGFRKMKAGHLFLKGNWEILEQLVCFDFKNLLTLAHLCSVAFGGSKGGCTHFWGANLNMHTDNCGWIQFSRIFCLGIMEIFFNFKPALHLCLGNFLWFEPFVIFCNCLFQFLSSREAKIAFRGKGDNFKVLQTTFRS